MISVVSNWRYWRGGLCQSNDNILSGAFVRTGKGNN